MNWKITYNKQTDITGQEFHASQLINEISNSSISTGILQSINESDDNDYEFSLEFDEELSEGDKTELSSVIQDHVVYDNDYEIYTDVDITVNKSHTSINYKTELMDGIAYTPKFTFHTNGIYSGLLDKTEYYRNYVDPQNKGTLILSVHEIYVVDESDATIPNSAKLVLSRTKTWKYYKKNGQVDDTNTKTKPKIYDTPQKRRNEGVRRRNNILDQLINNVATAGVISGIFIDENEAYDSLVLLAQDYAAAFNGWVTSGRGTLVEDVDTDVNTTWLDSAVSNASNQPAPYDLLAPVDEIVPWMMDMSLRDYIKSKLRGEIQ